MENYDQPWKQLNLSANASAEEPAHDTPLVSEDVPTLTKNNRYSLSSFTQCHTHVLRHLFIDKPTSTRSLRVRVHNFIFPLKDNRNFVSRVLYEAICPPPDCA